MAPRPILVYSQPIFSARSDRRNATNLSILTSPAQRQRKSIGGRPSPLNSDEVQLILAELRERVEAVARLRHPRAERPADPAIDLGEYVQDASAAVVAALSSDRNIRLRFACEPHCLVPLERALWIGLVIVELVTNAVRYAHPTGVAGEIKVACTQAQSGTITLEVSDDGVGLPEGLDPLKADSLGLLLVRWLAEQLSAQIQFAHDALGLTCLLQIPGKCAHDFVEPPMATARRTTMTHKNYRCYFTDAGDRIRSCEEIACVDDSAAALKVDELLATSLYGSAELWQGKRLVGKWTVSGFTRAEESNGK